MNKRFLEPNRYPGPTSEREIRTAAVNPPFSISSHVETPTTHKIFAFSMVTISENDQPERTRSEQVFTAESASKVLPLVSSIVREMTEIHGQMKHQRAQLSGLDEIRLTIESDAYEDEVNDVRKSLEETEQQFDACCCELKELGVNPHDPFDGSVDFPAIYNRRLVSLCWTYGEDRIAHWHELSEAGKIRRELKPEFISGAAV